MLATFESGVSFEVPTPETRPGDFARWSVDHSGEAHPDSPLGKTPGGGLRCPCGPLRVFGHAEYRARRWYHNFGWPAVVVYRERYVSIDREEILLLHLEPWQR